MVVLQVLQTIIVLYDFLFSAVSLTFKEKSSKKTSKGFEQ